LVSISLAVLALPEAISFNASIPVELVLYRESFDVQGE
jgi:hypothetical protein